MKMAFLVGVATLAMSGMGQAAMGPVQPALAPVAAAIQPPPAPVAAAIPVQSPAAAAIQPALAPVPAKVQTAQAPVAAASAVADATVAAFVHAQSQATRQLGGPPGRGGPAGDVGSCFSTSPASLSGALRCFLESGAGADDPQAGGTSAAPLPGALWLFASALLVFLGISARRSF
jgi:hypothetical protein